MIQSFLKILSSVINLFLELPVRDPEFSGKSAGGRSELPGFGNGS